MAFLRLNWRIAAETALVAMWAVSRLAGQAGPPQGRFGPSDPAQGTSTYTVFSSVQFTVPTNWPVVKKKSEVERALFVFRVPNSADQGTSDATTLAVEGFDLKDASAKAAYDAVPLPQGPEVRERKLMEGWDCNSYATVHETTVYDVWTCRRTLKDSGVFIRLTWPQLAGNAPDYEKQMRSALTGVLTSIIPAPQTPSLHDSAK